MDWKIEGPKILKLSQVDLDFTVYGFLNKYLGKFQNCNAVWNVHTGGQSNCL